MSTGKQYKTDQPINFKIYPQYKIENKSDQ